MRRATLNAMALGLGLIASNATLAQTTTKNGTTRTSTSSTTRTELRSAATREDTRLRDAKALIGASLSTTAGRYGTVVDFVFDGSGVVQYAVVERQGQFHPVPFSLLQFGSTGDITIAASAAALDAVTIDRNNLQSLSNAEFAARMRSAFGANVIRSLTGSSTTAANSVDSNQTASASLRNQVFSMAGLLGGSIRAQGGSAGTISTIAIEPNGAIAYSVGANETGDARFAVPFNSATFINNGSGIQINMPVPIATSVVIQQGQLPNFSDPSFAQSLASAFPNDQGIAGKLPGLTKQESDSVRRNDQSNRDPVAAGDRSMRNQTTGNTGINAGGANDQGIAGKFPGLTKQESDVVRRNDQSNQDPVAGAGDPSSGGANAVAAAGDPNRGGAAAVARPGDRAMPKTTSGTTGTTTGGVVNLAQDPPPATSGSASASGVIQLRDLLTFRVQAQDGAFGRIGDVVFDHNGNIQYLLVSHQGAMFPIPFTPSWFATSQQTIQLEASSAQMLQLRLDQRNLPSMNNAAFVQGMQSVFGERFGANVAASTTAGTNASGATRPGTSATSGSNPTGPRTPPGVPPHPNPFTKRNRQDPTSRPPGNTAGGTSGTTTAGPANDGAGFGVNPDNWTWPSNPTFGTSGTTHYPPGTRTAPGRRPTPGQNQQGTNNDASANDPIGPKRPAGTPQHPNPFTKNQQGIRSNCGNMDNSGVGTGGRTLNPPPRGKVKGQPNPSTGAPPPGKQDGATGGSTGTGTGGAGGSTGGSGGGSTGGASGSGS